VNPRYLAVGLGVLGLGIVSYALLARQTDEEKILEVLNRLEIAVHVDDESSNPLARMSQVNGHFSDIFEEDVQFKIPEHTSANHGRKTLVGLVVQIGPYFRNLDIDFKDVTIDFEMDNQRAKVASNAHADGFARNGHWADQRRVRLDMNQADGDWRIERLVVSPKDEEAEEEE
jgi:hypothetical protein